MELRKESGCGYEVNQDDEDCFRLTWDDGRELLSIAVS